MLIGALFRGKEALHAGGNDVVQLKLPGFGVVTTSEKYTLNHSKHTGICFFVLIWDPGFHLKLDPILRTMSTIDAKASAHPYQKGSRLELMTMMASPMWRDGTSTKGH